MNHLTQIVFDAVFMISCAIGVHVVALWMRGDNFQVAHSGTVFTLIPSQQSNASRSLVYSALLLGGGLALLVTFMVFLTKNVTGEQFGMFMVGTQTFSAVTFSFRKYPNRNMLGVVLGLVGGVLAAWGWQVYDNWIVANLAALLICSFLVHLAVRAVPIRSLVCGCVAIVLYDLWGVWGHQVGGGAIMESVGAMAKTRLPPGMIISPYLPLMVHSKAYSMLGLGDIFFPAYVTITAAAYKLHGWVIAAYILGMIGAGSLAYVMPQGVPAMVTILPAMIVTLLVVAKVKKVKLV